MTTLEISPGYCFYYKVFTLEIGLDQLASKSFKLILSLMRWYTSLEIGRIFLEAKSHKSFVLFQLTFRVRKFHYVQLVYSVGAEILWTYTIVISTNCSSAHLVIRIGQKPKSWFYYLVSYIHLAKSWICILEILFLISSLVYIHPRQKDSRIHKWNHSIQFPIKRQFSKMYLGNPLEVLDQSDFLIVRENRHDSRKVTFLGLISNFK